MHYLQSIGSAVLYGVCSTSMAFLNKAIISSFSFDFPLCIMACQMITCIILLELLRLSRAVSISKYTLKSGKSFLWPSIFYALHSYTALHALGGMSIPMYVSVKRCAPIVTLLLSVVFLHKKYPSALLTVSVVFISVGCILASYGDLKFDLSAYSYGAISVLAQALYLTLAQKSLQSMSALEVLHISSYNTVLFFVLLSGYQEYQGIMQFYGFSDPAFLSCFAVQISMGVLLNYSLFLCTEKNSALTTSLIGVLKSILQTFVGVFTFGGIDFTPWIISGLCLNMFGGVLYTYAKYREKISEITFTLNTLSKTTSQIALA